MRTDLLICPLCQAALTQQANSLCCPQQHTFDLARQGYVNLLPVQQKHSKHPGDAKAMVDARSRFLDSGVYQPIAQALADKALQQSAQADRWTLLDAGCGEGYYTQFIHQQLAARPGLACHTLGLDISKAAISAATRRQRDIIWLVASNAHPPLQPASIDMMLCLFGFPSYAGMAPLLKPQGSLWLVDPGPNHLIELRQRIYPSVNQTPPPAITAAAAYGLQLQQESLITFQTDCLTHAQIQDLLGMTPYLYRATAQARAAAAQFADMRVTVEVVLRQLGAA